MPNFIVDMEAPRLRDEETFRAALTQAPAASEVGRTDRDAATLGMDYAETEAGGDVLAREADARRAGKVPGGRKWVAEGPENSVYLEENAAELKDTFDSLVSNGILQDSEVDWSDVETFVRQQQGMADAVERAHIQNRRVDLAEAYRKGEITAEEARTEAERLNGELDRLQQGETGLAYSALEQIVRMTTRDVPHALRRGAEGLLMGGSAAAIAGSVVPGIGNVVSALGGAVAGGQAGLARGFFESSQESNRAEFLLNMLLTRDDAGKYLDEAAIRNSAELYGLAGAAVDVAGAAVAGKLLGPALRSVKNVFGFGAGELAEEAALAAAKDSRLAPMLLRAMRDAGLGAAAEGATEGVQQALSEQMQASVKNDLHRMGLNWYEEKEKGLAGREAWKNIAAAVQEGAGMGLVFHVLPGLGRLALDRRAAGRARNFAEKNIAAAEKMDVVRGQGKGHVPPARVESYLKSCGLHQTVYLPASEAWKLQKSGVNMAEALGRTEEDLAVAATLGHDIEVPLARIHAAPVSVEIKKRLFAELREHPFAPSAAEALEESILSRDVADVQASLEAWNRVRGPLEEGLSRIHRQLESAVYASPELMRRLSGKEGGSDGATQYVDAHMQVIRRMAWYLSTVTPDAETILNRLDVQSLVSDIEHGRLTSPADREKRLSGALTDFDEPEGKNGPVVLFSPVNVGVDLEREIPITMIA